MKINSYHIFYFPFKWECKNQKEKSVNERFDLSQINIKDNSDWDNLPDPKTDQYKAELYNEKNYFYDFVHPVLYDIGEKDQVMQHFERKEAYTNNLTYTIKVIAGKTDIYELNLISIGLNLYSTGTGVLTFYLKNENYKLFDDILRINQFGRRISPPFIDIEKGIKGVKEIELADFISITGLSGDKERYTENFESFSTDESWKPALFIESLIEDLSDDIKAKPVTDDRMFVSCWYGNNGFSKSISESEGSFSNEFIKDWYRFIFVDGGKDPMCMNKKMRKKLAMDSTYLRWQEYGCLNGITRYSFMYLTQSNPDEFLITYFRTMYARIVELALVQRATILKFSDEVAILSNLKSKKEMDLSTEINRLYKEYIRFVNQIYFREVTAQEQGIELYNMVQQEMKIQDQVKDLDNEIKELFDYATLDIEIKQNRKIATLSILGAIFLPATLIIGLFGMNTMPANESIPTYFFGLPYWPFWISLILIGIISYLAILFLNKRYELGMKYSRKKKTNKK